MRSKLSSGQPEVVACARRPGPRRPDDPNLRARRRPEPSGPGLLRLHLHGSHRALAAAGIDRSRVYVTNAVKHFKFEPRGKRRIHAKPGVVEIDACRWWIEQERAILRPRVTIAMGGTAARSLLGRAVTVSRDRGRPIAMPDGGEAWVTVHPSYLLRLPDKDRVDDEHARFVEDLRRAASHP